MPFTLVHCADVHLDTTFPEVRGGAVRRKALADALVRIVDEALRLDADALSIGGDLYESERAGPQTARFLCQQLGRFGKPVFIAPGNHDPHFAGALLARHDLPDNIRVFNEAAWRAIPLADEITLYGFGHTPAEPGRPFARARFDRGGIQIALVHGSDEDRCPPHKRATAPFTKVEVLDSGATLLLTGHYHGGYVETEKHRPVFGYPGSPEPIKFGERGSHGALVVQINGSSLTVRPIEIARTRLAECDCDLSAAASDHDVFERVSTALDTFGSNDFVRLRLTGATMAGTRIDKELMIDRCGASLGALEIIDDSVGYHYESLAREPTVRGRVVRDLLELGDADDPERAARARAALRYALAAFDGREIAP